jgi:hypothetical protein
MNTNPELGMQIKRYTTGRPLLFRTGRIPGTHQTMTATREILIFFRGPPPAHKFPVVNLAMAGLTPRRLLLSDMKFICERAQNKVVTENVGQEGPEAWINDVPCPTTPAD